MVTTAVGQASLLVAFPVATAAVGSVLAAVRRPGPRLRSAIQHFAAGVVFAAVAGEVLPDLRKEGNLGSVIGGFALGVALVLNLGAYSRRQGASASLLKQNGRLGRLPIGLLTTIGIDLLIDGMLVGLGATLGSNQGLILTIALTIEVLFLGLSVCVELLELGIRPARATAICSGLGLATAVGAIGSAVLLGGASPAVIAGTLAFGAAALLYLVVEELLIEAHRETETPALGAMFFVGFIGLYLLAGLSG